MLRDRGRAVRAGGDLPVGDPQPRVAAVELHVDAAGREGPVVEVAPVRVVERLGELADHLQPGVAAAGPGVPAMKWSRRCQFAPCRKTTAGPARSSSLYCSARTMPSWEMPCSARYSRCAARWTDSALFVGRGPLGEVDADPSGLVGRAATGWWRGSPPRSGRRRRTSRLELVGADPADLVQPGDADLLQELRELLGEGRRDPVTLAARRLVEEAGPDAVEAGLLVELVAAVDALALELVELAAEVLRGQEDGRLDAGNAAP